MTAIDGEPANPRQEFWVSVVGPISSLAVAAVAFALSLVAPGGLIGLAVGGVAYTNLLVGRDQPRARAAARRRAGAEGRGLEGHR